MHIAARHAFGDEVRQSEVLAGLSYALDLTEGQRPGHSVRSCLIGMRIAQAMQLSPADQSSLYYALLMKDLGCSSNAARFAALFGSHDHDLKADIKRIDWTRAIESFRFVARNAAPGQFLLKRTWRLLAIMARGPEGAREVVQTRCERGADIAGMLGLAHDTVHAIRALDEHWDGQGQPYSKKGEQIPPLARILGLAQTVEVFFTTYDLHTAYEMAAARRGTWFDPAVVDAFFSIPQTDPFWKALGSANDLDRLKAFEPESRVEIATEEKLDTIASAFASVIDAKSPWTFRHSNGVAEYAVAMAERLAFSARDIRRLRRTALLHDLGKLGVSNLILDKPGPLTDEEFLVMKRHPEHTTEILSRVSCFRGLAEDAGSHHERLDGRGYHRRLHASELSLSARILAAADICDALRSSRPYRAGLPIERVLEIMGREAGSGLDPEVYATLESALTAANTSTTFEVPAARLVTSLSEDYQQAA
jgi:HD-GYP domain-containing protein (c-di-GMP phosphodiesterase class II)